MHVAAGRLKASEAATGQPVGSRALPSLLLTMVGFSYLVFFYD